MSMAGLKEIYSWEDEQGQITEYVWDDSVLRRGSFALFDVVAANSK